MRYARLNYGQLERRLPVLVEQGLLSKKEITLHDWPHQAARVWPKHRAKAMRVIYKLTDKGYEYLRNKQQRQQERDGDTSNTQQQQEQHQATIRSIDETKNNSTKQYKN